MSEPVRTQAEVHRVRYSVYHNYSVLQYIVESDERSSDWSEPQSFTTAKYCDIVDSTAQLATRLWCSPLVGGTVYDDVLMMHIPFPWAASDCGVSCGRANFLAPYRVDNSGVWVSVHAMVKNVEIQLESFELKLVKQTWEERVREGWK